MTCGGIEGGVNNATGTPRRAQLRRESATECHPVTERPGPLHPFPVDGLSNHPRNRRVTCAILRDLRLSGQVVSLGGHSPSTTYRFPYTYRFLYALYGIMYVEAMKGVTCGGRARLTTPVERRVQTPIPIPIPTTTVLAYNVMLSCAHNRTQMSNSLIRNNLRFDIISVIRPWHAHTRPQAGGAAPARMPLSPSRLSLSSNPLERFGQFLKHFGTKGVA